LSSVGFRVHERNITPLVFNSSLYYWYGSNFLLIKVVACFAGMLSLRNGLGLEAKNYGLGLGCGLGLDCVATIVASSFCINIALCLDFSVSSVFLRAPL